MALKAHLSPFMLTVANAFNTLGAIRDPDEMYVFILEFPHVLFSCKVSKDSTYNNIAHLCSDPANRLVRGEWRGSDPLWLAT